VNDFQSILSVFALLLGVVLTLLKIVELFVKLKLPNFLRGVLSNSTVGWIVAGLALIVLAATAYPGRLWSTHGFDNSAVERFDFENSDEGWSSVDLKKVESTGDIFLSDGGSFPGTLRASLSTEYASSGESSLKLDVDVQEAGSYKGFIYRAGSLVAQGITIFVMTPEIPDSCDIGYVQLCVPSHKWACSGGTHLVPGEWVPLVIDLAGPADGGPPIDGQVLKELAIQWVFDTDTGASYDLYVDAGEVLSSR